MEDQEPGFEAATIVARQLMKRGPPFPKWLQDDLMDDTRLAEDGCPRRMPSIGPMYQVVLPLTGVERQDEQEERGMADMTGVDKLKELFREHGRSEYIGEDVSQLEHALQAAAWAEVAMEPPCLIMAALCHDVGHLLMLAGHDLKPMEGLGAHKHAVAGAEWLENELGLGNEVTDPVRLHVAAKRYQAFKIPRYVQQSLSPASQRTLELQGGPMSDEEARQFETHPMHKEALRLRAYDNAAKVKGEETWTLDEALAASGHGS